MPKSVPLELVKQTDVAVVTQREAARILNVTPYKVRQAAGRGQLEMVQVGGRDHVVSINPETDRRSLTSMSRRPAAITQADVTRVIKAALAVGMSKEQIVEIKYCRTAPSTCCSATAQPKIELPCPRTGGTRCSNEQATAEVRHRVCR
jgi:hypothetical protein